MSLGCALFDSPRSSCYQASIFSQVPFLKAVQIHAHGGIDQLRYEDTDEPQLHTHHDVIVKLKAAAVNRIDLAVAGWQRLAARISLSAYSWRRRRRHGLLSRH